MVIFCIMSMSWHWHVSLTLCQDNNKRARSHNMNQSFFNLCIVLFILICRCSLFRCISFYWSKYSNYCKTLVIHLCNTAWNLILSAVDNCFENINLLGNLYFRIWIMFYSFDYIYLFKVAMKKYSIYDFEITVYIFVVEMMSW